MSMYHGHCLCQRVSWELSAEPYAVYNCYCRMCQKAHGAAFATYCFVTGDQFRWTGATDSISHYRSSEVLVRAACNICGSVVPYDNGSGDQHHWAVPGGCHDDMKKPDCNIFVADNSPWHTIGDDLPQYDEYPAEAGLTSVEGVAAIQKTSGDMQGSCLCGAVTYTVTKPFTTAHNCHCSRCRHARAAAHASNAFVAADGIHYQTGEHHLRAYKVADAKYFTQVFCALCSSPMPRINTAFDLAAVPLASLDHDPQIRPVDHIYVADKAKWYDITDELPQFAQGPG